jgi:hypothetical protein
LLWAGARIVMSAWQINIFGDEQLVKISPQFETPASFEKDVGKMLA